MNSMRKYWAASLKEVGQKLIDTADDICKDIDDCSCVDIWISCTTYSVTTMKVEKEHSICQCFFMEGDNNESNV